MASQLIGTTETGWFNPGVNPPPFDMKLLLMVAGSRSEDCGRTFEPYTVVMTAYVQQQGPGDEYDDEPAFDEYMAGDQTDFLDFQFDLKDEDGEVLDWYSDSVVAWAYYPLGIAQTAVNVERERQAALVPKRKSQRRRNGVRWTAGLCRWWKRRDEMTDYKSMFEQAVRTLAAIDEALGIGDDGCGDPDQTLTAIAELKATKLGDGKTATVTREMIGAAHDVMLAKGDFVLSAALLERIYLAMEQAAPPPQTPFNTCPTCEALARAVMMDQTGAA